MAMLMPPCLKIGVFEESRPLRSVFIEPRDLTTKEKQKAEMQANRDQSQVEFESLGMEHV